MTKVRSLRWRLVSGAVLWTIGLFAVTHYVSATMIVRYPSMLYLAHSALLSVFALGLMMAGFAQLRRGLSPFNLLRHRLSAVRDGRADRVEGSYPAEVQPLVDDLNALVEHREQIVRQAMAKAGDLAHGLKTPLAVLAQEAERAEASGHADLAATISHQVARMSRLVDYHLAQARAAALGATPGARCSVLESAEGLCRTLRRLHAERGLTIEVRVSPDHAVRGAREGLDEMLGNLLDNACTWAASRITITSTLEDATVLITVDDDGSGLDPAMWDVVMQRGVRTDQAAPGSGFGLAIVRDLAGLYGGSIALSRSPDGGVRARLQLPAC